VLVKRLAAARGIALPLPALEQLAEAVRDSVPALLSAMLQLDLDARAGKQDFEPRRIRKLVAQRKSDRMPSLRSIATLTAKHYGLTVADLKSPVRRQALVAGRGVAMYLARQLTDKSLEEIGDFFGGRDHTTVMHSCRRTERLVAVDRETRLAVTELKRTLLAP
jgi:chromosomal replication initiator protein